MRNDSSLIAMITPADQVYTYHYNAVGSTIAVTDQNQNIVNKYAYDEFGNITSQVEAVPQPFKFVGQYGVMTEPNGFYYMRARYYDPKVGRFISEDPIGFDGGDVNLMAYVGNNPVNLIDPDGNIAFAPLLYYAGAKAGAIATAYVGTKVAQWMANSLAGRNAVSNQVVNQAFTKVAAASAVSAAVPAIKIGGPVAVRGAASLAITNPQLVQTATKFIQGATPGSPPPTDWTEFAGAAAVRTYELYNEYCSSYGKRN